MTERCMERLRPDQFRTLREETPLAYLPLGILEWHGPQNPLGLDGVKAHALCRRVADQVGGIVFPTLYYRTARNLAQQQESTRLDPIPGPQPIDVHSRRQRAVGVVAAVPLH